MIEVGVAGQVLKGFCETTTESERLYKSYKST